MRDDGEEARDCLTMLLHLRIENFALIDTLELDFAGGMNVLTGETGAGKSIILDALDAVLGGKVSGSVVRSGAQRAVVEATFASDPIVEGWLAEQQIEPLEAGVLVSREVSGRTSRSRVNGVLVNQAALKGLREYLLEITAQGQSLQLGKPEVQLDLLDHFAGAWEVRSQVQQAFEGYQKRRARLERRRAEQEEQAKQLDFFRYQYDELSRADLEDPDEEEALQAERSRLAHAVELQRSSRQVYQLLYEGDTGSPAVVDLLGQASDLLATMGEYDASLAPLAEMIEAALVSVQECSRSVNRYGETVESDPEELTRIERRLRQLKGLKQKYSATLAELIARKHQLERDLAAIAGGDDTLAAEEAELAGELARVSTMAAGLTRLRTEAASRLEARLVAELSPLGMQKVRFAAALEPAKLSATGADRVCFLWSPNPGEALAALTETASGGEMARFLLALKACLGGADRIGTLVFDEIDIGVSGRVAQAVADKLLELGRNHQVLCVTHQPLVAAMADRHYRVAKRTQAEGDGERTVVRVEVLSQLEARREELAQLAGGRTAREALDFASSLLTEAARRRHNPVNATSATTTNPWAS